MFGFVKNGEEPYIYKWANGSVVIFLVLYMDDILFIGNDIPAMQGIKVWLSSQFSMNNLGKASYILGMRIYRIDQGSFWECPSLSTLILC